MTYTDTRYYKEMVKARDERETSIRGLAKECGLCYGTLIEFFNVDKPFRPLSFETRSKIHNRLGIPFEVIDEYNNFVLEERKRVTNGD